MGEVNDEVKFRALFATYSRPLLAFALRRFTSPNDAADVLAETMSVAWRRIEDVPDEPETRLWLYGVARNIISNVHRGNRRRDRLATKLASQLHGNVEWPTDVDWENVEPINHAMSLLNQNEREVLRLTVWEMLSPSEIAVVLDLKSETVRTQLHRARTKLRTVLTNEINEMKRECETGHVEAESSTFRLARREGVHDD